MTYMGLIISMFASLLLIISDITALLIIGRILQGLSAAILLPSTVGVLNNQFKGEHLRRAISYLMISTVGHRPSWCYRRFNCYKFRMANEFHH